MLFKQLGKTGVKIPEIGFGTWQSRSAEALNLAIELGAAFIDTAESYGTEELVGKVIQGNRKDVFLATKVSGNHFRYDDVLKAAANSLQRLKTSYIDLYQLHFPNPDVPIGETMRAMEKLVKDGVVKYIGISNFSAKQSKEAQEALSRNEVTSNQVEYSLLNREIDDELLPFCEAEKITIIAYSPVARGSLAGKSLRKVRLSSVLEEVAKKYGKAVVQVALNWITTRNSVVAIPKADKLEHVRENYGASGWRLSNDDYELIDKASK